MVKSWRLKSVETWEEQVTRLAAEIEAKDKIIDGLKDRLHEYADQVRELEAENRRLEDGRA